MTGYELTYSIGRIHSGEDEIVYVPRGGIARNKRALILCHGWLATGKVFGVDYVNAPKQCALAHALASQGFLVAATSLGGTTSTDQWGNATASARMAELHTWLAAQYGCDAGKVLTLGISMGNTTALSYHRDYGKVAAHVGIMPASDLNDLRINNRIAGVRADIDLAWGVTYPAALPSGADPLLSAARYSDVPMRLLYSSGDAVVIPSTVTALAAAVGSSVSTAVISALGHSDAVVAAVDVAKVTSFLRNYDRA